MKQKRKYEQVRMTVIELSSASQLLAESDQPAGPVTSNSNMHLVAMGSAGTLE